MADGDFFGIGAGLLGNGGAGFNPTQLGLLQGGLALMQSRRGEGFSGALGRAGMAGVQGYASGTKAAEDKDFADQRKAYIGAQTDALKQKQAKDAQIMSALGPLFGNQQQGQQAQPVAQSMPVSMGGVDQGLLSGGMMGDQSSGGLLGQMPTQQAPQMPQQAPQMAQAQQQGTPQGQQQGQGGFPFTLPQVMAIHAIGGPDLLPAYKYATDGVKRDAGAYYDNPITGQRQYIPKLGDGMAPGADGRIASLPGYLESNASIQGAQAGAIAAGQEAARAPYVGRNEAATQAARYPYQVAGQINQASLDTVPVIGPDGDTQYSSRLAVTQPGLAGGQGVPGAPGQGAISARNPVTQDAAKSINADWLANSYRKTVDAGQAASGLSNSLQAFRGIDLNTGWGTEAKVQAASILGALGVKDAEKYAGEAQKFQSVGMDRLLNTLKEQSGPQTEGDAQRAGKTFASLSNTPQANAFIADFAQAQANQQQRKAQFYEMALPIARDNGGDLTKVDREWRKVQGSIWSDPVLAPYARGR